MTIKKTFSHVSFDFVRSNFISLFRMLAEMRDKRLQFFVSREGGPDALLFCGRKRTQRIEVELRFDRGAYDFELGWIFDKLA